MAGVSVGTIDRVIHNRGEVSDITRNKVIRIIKKSHYVPDILARTLASKKIFRFAVLFPKENPDSTFWSKPLAGVNKALKEVGHYGIVGEKYLFDQFNRSSFKRQTERILQHEPDAILIAPFYHEETAGLIKNCSIRNIPYVFVNSDFQDNGKLSFIGQDSKQSGYLAARLMSYSIEKGSGIIIVNISKALDNHKHILSRQTGFESFFKENKNQKIDILVHNIKDMDKNAVNNILNEIFSRSSGIKGVFVTNSKVYKVARFIKENRLQNLRLIGYDLTEENIKYVEDNIIDFLISQRPVEQGYGGIMTLFNHFVLNRRVKKEQHLPIDIITKENYKFYIKH
jgi:LacI family transcriptional regulator